VSAAHSAQRAYARTAAPTRTPRTLEYDLLARATQRLSQAWPDRRFNFAALASALNENLTLWSTLAADVADPENGLPPALRARLFYIYQFTEKHSRDVLTKDASVEVLTDINTAVMRGLRGEASAA
jgi:flagellar biosynthesis activator protein FlaF